MKFSRLFTKTEYAVAYCLEFMEIENFDFNNYDEKHIKSIRPNEIKTNVRIHRIAGIHTYNRIDAFEVVDLKLCTFSIKHTFLKLKIVLQVLIEKLLHLERS